MYEYLTNLFFHSSKHEENQVEEKAINTGKLTGETILDQILVDVRARKKRNSSGQQEVL